MFSKWIYFCVDCCRDLLRNGMSAHVHCYQSKIKTLHCTESGLLKLFFAVVVVSALKISIFYYLYELFSEYAFVGSCSKCLEKFGIFCVGNWLLTPSYIVSINGEDVRLMLWDTAGQEEFDAITKAYYRGIEFQIHLT